MANEKSYEKCELPGNMERASGRFRMLLTVDAVRKKYAYRYIELYRYIHVYDGICINFTYTQILVCAFQSVTGCALHSKVDQDGLLPARSEQRTSYRGDTVATGPRCHANAAETARPGFGVETSVVDIGSCR